MICSFEYKKFKKILIREVEIFDKLNNSILEFNDKFVKDNYFIRTIKDTQSHIMDYIL